MLADASAKAEARLRSRRVSLILGIVAAGVVAFAWLAGFRVRLAGALTLGHLAIFTAVSWSLTELASSAFRQLGACHRVYRVARVLDEMARSAALMIALGISGSAAGLFMLVNLTRGFVRRAQPPEDIQRTWVAQGLGHLSVASVFVALEMPERAMLILLAFCAFVIAYLMTTRLESAAARVRVERDLLEREGHQAQLGSLRARMARELHDGVGADIMALVLTLRRDARSEPSAAALSEEAQRILEDLRGVVWSLKNEQGTLGELAKLVDARCGRVRGDLRYERAPVDADAHRNVPAATSIAVLRVASELVGAAAKLRGVRGVRVSLEAKDALELSIEVEGGDAGFSAAASEAIDGWEEDSGATLTFSEGAGASVRARFPLT